MTDRERKAAKHEAVGDWSASGDFFGAILAGLLLGLLADWLFGTRPWIVVGGIVAGFAVGFWRMYDIAKRVEQEEMLRRSRRPHP